MNPLEPIRSLILEYADNKIVIAVVAALAGGFIKQFLPAIARSSRRLFDSMLRRVSGRYTLFGFRRAYLDWVINELRELKLAGIVAYDDAKKPQLEQVFVSLRIRSDRSGSSAPEGGVLEVGELVARRRVRVGFSGRFIAGTSRTDYPISYTKYFPKALGLRVPTVLRWIRGAFEQSPPSDEELYIVEDERGWRAYYRIKNRQEHFKDVADILLHHDRVAILGVPGAGKSTLLQYVALAYAREKTADRRLRRRGTMKERLRTKSWRLPIYIPLGSIASRLLPKEGDSSQPSLLDVLPALLPPDLQSDAGAEKFFQSHVQSGKCIFLLDGLDEVASDAEFNSVVRAIESLAVRYSKNQFLVTSRIAGWRTGVGADFVPVYVNDLTTEQIEAFIDTWYSAVERNAVIGRLQDEGSSERRTRERRGAQKAADLKRAVRENAGIRRLATNPMLLSIIALVHRSLATLPRERSKLYAECSKILLEQWDISRGVRVDDTGLKLEQKEALIRRLAFALHTGKIGDPKAGREASRAEVELIIAEALPSLGRNPDEAAKLLQRLIERSGVLMERRRNVLSFAHHTFQEYFAAQYLATQEPETAIEFLLQRGRLFSDWWREVVLLLAGLQNDCTALLRAIYGSKHHDLCGTRLRLAGLCLSEAVEVHDQEVRSAIVSDIVRIRAPQLPSGEEPHAKFIAEAMSQWCKSENWYAAASLASLQAAQSAAAVPPLINNILEALTNGDGPAKRAALAILRILGPSKATKAVVRAVLANLRAPDQRTANAALITAIALNDHALKDTIAHEVIEVGISVPALRDEMFGAATEHRWTPTRKQVDTLLDISTGSGIQMTTTLALVAANKSRLNPRQLKQYDRLVEDLVNTFAKNPPAHIEVEGVLADDVVRESLRRSAWRERRIGYRAAVESNTDFSSDFIRKASTLKRKEFIEASRSVGRRLREWNVGQSMEEILAVLEKGAARQQEFALASLTLGRLAIPPGMVPHVISLGRRNRRMARLALEALLWTPLLDADSIRFITERFKRSFSVKERRRISELVAANLVQATSAQVTIKIPKAMARYAPEIGGFVQPARASQGLVEKCINNVRRLLRLSGMLRRFGLPFPYVSKLIAKRSREALAFANENTRPEVAARLVELFSRSLDVVELGLQLSYVEAACHLEKHEFARAIADLIPPEGDGEADVRPSLEAVRWVPLPQLRVLSDEWIQSDQADLRLLGLEMFWHTRTFLDDDLISTAELALADASVHALLVDEDERVRFAAWSILDLARRISSGMT